MTRTTTMPDAVSTPPVRNNEVFHVLVVDDNASVRLLVAQLLTVWGMTPVTATDGITALQELHGHIDLVLTDYRMPALNGLELTARIHSHDSQIPVIIMSGDDGEQLIKEATRRGVFAWVQKPFDPQHLRAVIMTALQAQSADDAVRSNVSQHAAVPARAVA